MKMRNFAKLKYLSIYTEPHIRNSQTVVEKAERVMTHSKWSNLRQTCPAGGDSDHSENCPAFQSELAVK